MKKILVLNFSPRKKGNCAAVTQLMADEMKTKGAEVTVCNSAEMNLNPCVACGACKTKDVPFCAQKDDFEALLPLIDACDGIVFAAPVYFGQVPGPAKNFIDRLYCFFNPARKEPLFTVKESKKIAVIFTCGGGPADVYDGVAKWVGGSFGACGVNEVKTLVKSNLNGLWDAEGAVQKELAAEALQLAAWVTE